MPILKYKHFLFSSKYKINYPKILAKMEHLHINHVNIHIFTLNDDIIIFYTFVESKFDN